MTMFASRWHGARAQLAVLAALAVYFLVWPVWRIGFPIEIDRNEGWNAYWADAAAGLFLHAPAAPLYPAADTLLVNNYPPLSFYVVGGLAQMLGGDAVYVGRALSLAAVLGLGVLIAAVIRQLGGGLLGAAAGGLWFVATMARAYSAYVGMNDPQLAGHFLMMGALVWFLSREARGASVVAPVIAMAAAGFYKHNIIGVPVTALMWLALKDWRRAVWPAAIGAGAAAAGLAVCAALYGDAFLANLLTPRGYHLMRAVNGVGRLQWIAPALALWAVWAAAEPASRAARFTMLFVAVSFVAFFAQATGDGIGDNSHFDLVIATAAGLGLAFDRAGKTAFGRRHGEAAARAVIVLVVAVRLLANLRIMEPALVLFSPDYRAQYFINAQVVRDEAARIAQIPGPVACGGLMVCRLAGKPFVYDAFRAEMLVATGASGGLDTDGLMRAHGITEDRGDPRTGIGVLFRPIAFRR
jgi:hypothetical protein